MSQKVMIFSFIIFNNNTNGNLDDNIKKIKYIKKVEIIFAEDTSITRNLLNYLEINKN